MATDNSMQPVIRVQAGVPFTLGGDDSRWVRVMTEETQIKEILVVADQDLRPLTGFAVLHWLDLAKPGDHSRPLPA